MHPFCCWQTKSVVSDVNFLQSSSPQHSSVPWHADKNFLIGFDVTFDSLLRILQSKSFESTAEEEATQYVKLKFKYSKNVIGTHINKGFYILQHDTDNIIKEIKAN